jgi:DNA-binding transcriptional regulator YiaG
MATNIAALLKAEITRLSRREIRAANEGLQRASTAHRSDIAALKRRLSALEQFVKHIAKLLDKADIAVPITASAAGEAKQRRFSPARFAAERARLNFSARQMGLLVGVSQAVIYAWESGNARPNEEQMQRVVARRGIKPESALEAIGEGAVSGRAKRKAPAA